MPIAPLTELVPISTILVDRPNRQRRQITTTDLEASIAKLGLIHAITVERATMQLRTGERRLTACAALGWSEIPVRFWEDLSPVDAQLVELEENIKRQDLEWTEIVTSVARIHQLYLSADPEWTMSETAEAIGLSQPTISMYLRVNSELTSNERVANAGTVREAYNVIGRLDARRAGDALAELLEDPAVGNGKGVDGPIGAGGVVDPDGADADGAPVHGLEIPHPSPAPYPATPIPPTPLPPAESILSASFLDWAPQYTGPKFSLVHCDFPYGVNLFSGPQGRGSEPTEGYTDTTGTYWELVDCLCDNLDRLMSVSSHLVFWLSADWRVVWETVERFRQRAPSLEFHKFPLVWVKSDNAGIAADVRRLPRHTYELALLASRGKRQLVQVKADAYNAPTDKRLHPSTKPEPMLRHFFTMLVDQHSTVLDPTCGSGASLRAAESLGAKRVLGLEIDPEFAAAARKALAQSRALRSASAGATPMMKVEGL